MAYNFFISRFNPFTGRKQYLRSPRLKFWTYEPSLAHKFSRSGVNAFVDRHNSDCLPGFEYFVEPAL